MEEDLEMLKKEIEELPEGEEFGPPPSTEEEESGEPGTGEAVEGGETTVSAQVEEKPIPSTEAREPEEVSEIEKRRQRLKELLEIYRDATSLARTLSDLSPEDRALVHSIVNRVLGEPEKKEEVKPVIVEKPVVKEVEKPVPVVPEHLSTRVEEAAKTAESALTRIASVESRLAKYEEMLNRLAETQRDVSIALKTIVSATTNYERLREEMRKLREELERIRKEREQQLMVIPRSEMLRPDGSVVREYDLHPSLKAIEKRTDFAVEKLGPALIQELRATRSDISSSINRLVTLVEAIITPELRRRAPHIVEDIEERIRKLVGTLTPEQRIRELEELEKKLTELEKTTKEGEKK